MPAQGGACPAGPGRETPILLVLATNTYNAYNTWGGRSLYGGTRGHATRVSFNRPYAGLLLDDEFTSRYSGWRKWGHPFVAWAASSGYHLDYAVNSDLEFHPEILRSYRLVLSVGHDEYWSAPMRDHLEAFIASGGNAAFFSGNAVDGVVAMLPNQAGVPHRAISRVGKFGGDRERRGQEDQDEARGDNNEP